MKKNTIQIRPSVSVEVAVVLEDIAKVKNMHLGKVLEMLLEESATFKKAKDAVTSAKEEAIVGIFGKIKEDRRS